MKNTFDLIRKWGEDKNIIHPSHSFKQLAKVAEELGEVSKEVIQNNPEKLKIEIGDLVITATMLAACKGLNIEDCIEAAYDKIKYRKGVSEGGVFVKYDNICDTCNFAEFSYFENPCNSCFHNVNIDDFYEPKPCN